MDISCSPNLPMALKALDLPGGMLISDCPPLELLRRPEQSSVVLLVLPKLLSEHLTQAQFLFMEARTFFFSIFWENR